MYYVRNKLNQSPGGEPNNWQTNQILEQLRYKNILENTYNLFSSFKHSEFSKSEIKKNKN